MKVLLVTANFHPEKTGISVTATDCAKFISELGNQVTVICGMPYYPEWKIRDGYRGKLFTTEMFHGITLRRVWLYVPSKPTSLRRIVHEVSFSALAFLRSVALRYDLVLCISPPLTSALAATLIGLVRSKKVWSYVQDIQPDTAVELGMLRNRKLIRLLQLVEKFIYQRSEKILTLSEGMAENIAAKGVPRSKLKVVPFSIDVKEIRRTDRQSSSFRQKNGLDSKFLVLYSGNLGVKHNPTIIVDCANILASHSNIFFAVVGEGAMKEAVQRRIEEYQLTNVRVFPLCERDELGDMLSSADVLVVSQRKEVVDIVLPSKLLAYFASGRSVVVCANPQSEAAKILRENKLGMVVPPDDPQALAEAILYLRAHSQEAEENGRRGYDYVLSNFDEDVVKAAYYKPLFSNRDASIKLHP